jgi:hypothetical protein
VPRSVPEELLTLARGLPVLGEVVPDRVGMENIGPSHPAGNWRCHPSARRKDRGARRAYGSSRVTSRPIWHARPSRSNYFHRYLD